MIEHAGGLWLEAFNGTWAILAIYCTAFLLIHLYANGATKHLSWWSGWHSDMPLGVQLAIGTMVSCFGVALSRTSIWIWRLMTGGDPAHLAEQLIPLAAGGAIGAMGFLCILRVITLARFGGWPTVLACVTVAAYWITFLFR
jgi:hypothetical protein